VFERFTEEARRVVVLAQEEARLLGHDYIGTEHLLLGLLAQSGGSAAATLASLGVSLDGARRRVEDMIGRLGGVPSGHIPFTPRAKAVLELSLRESLRLNDDHIGAEHILLGLVREGEGVAAQVLLQEGCRLDDVAARVVAALGDPSRIQVAAPMGWRPSSQAPVCGYCSHPLAGSLAARTLVAVADDGSEHAVRVVFCATCGRSLGAAGG
jgi:ATP-dependent Clp protease ATP-binding subunit ClpC